MTPDLQFAIGCLVAAVAAVGAHFTRPARLEAMRKAMIARMKAARAEPDPKGRFRSGGCVPLVMDCEPLELERLTVCRACGVEWDKGQVPARCPWGTT